MTEHLEEVATCVVCGAILDRKATGWWTCEGCGGYVCGECVVKDDGGVLLYCEHCANGEVPGA